MSSYKANVKAAHEVVVIGAGIIGLTTAIRLLEAGYSCAVIAKEVLSGTTSHTAASWWIPDPEYGKVVNDTTDQNNVDHDADYCEKNDHMRFLDCGFGSKHYQKWARETFNVMYEQSKQHGCGAMLCEGSRYLCTKEQTEEWRNIWFKDLIPSFTIEELKKSPMSDEDVTFDSVVHFSTLLTRMDIYLAWLRKVVFQLGGFINPFDGDTGTDVECLEDATYLIPSSSFMINCAGLNAAKLSQKHSCQFSKTGEHHEKLGNPSQEKIISVRGQTVLVDAPHILRHLSIGLVSSAASSIHENDDGISSVNFMKKRPIYIIPQGDGTVICGGSKDGEDVDKSPHPHASLQKEIIDNCSKLEPSLRDVPVIRNIVGFRPFRKGGVRIELDNKPIIFKEDNENSRQRVVYIVHNYGHADVGVILSWGCAAEVVEIVKSKFLNKK